MDHQYRHVISAGASDPMLRTSTLRTTTFSFPLARYTTRLIAADRRRMLLADCADRRSDDGLDASDDDDGGGCAYSRPVLVLDLVWNLAFVVVAAGVLLSTLRERPATPLRLWLCGYAFECVLHICFVFFEYRRRIGDPSLSQSPYSILKRLEPVNTLASSVWWVFGFYWIVVGGQALLEDSPQLYWNAASAYPPMLMEQNCIASPVPIISTVDASAAGSGQKQLARSANSISLEAIR
nr:uncharacterized protein LOC112754659 isoform X2 [Arachis hypogaea]